MNFYNKDIKRIYYDIMNEKGEQGVLVFLNGVMASTSSWINQYEEFKTINFILH